VQYPTATSIAVTGAHELRRVGSHGESIERQVNVPRLLQIIQEFVGLFPLEYGFSERKRSRRLKWASISRWGSIAAISSGFREPRMGPTPSTPGRGARIFLHRLRFILRFY